MMTILADVIPVFLRLRQAAGQGLSVALLTLALVACGDADRSASQNAHDGHANAGMGSVSATQGAAAPAMPGAQAMVHLDVFKSATCGCCQLWIDHAEDAGFHAVIHHPEDLTQEKLQRGIGYSLHSCHTAVASDGSVFEGHMPAKLIHQYLQERPANTLGLAVPGMPLGSPGMEVGGHFAPYDVMLLHTDGSTSVYHRVESAAEQY
jgi:hypothetical protein